APSASVATALVARHAIVQPTRPVVRSASPATVASPGRDIPFEAMASRDYKGLPATMPGDVPVGGPGRAGPPPIYCPSDDRPTAQPRRWTGGPGVINHVARRRRRSGGAGALSPAAEPRVAAVPDGAGADIYARWVYGHRFLLPVYGIAISLILWVAAAGLIHVIARTLGGRGDFAGLAKLVGYAALVGLVALPVALVDALLKLQGATRVESSFGQLAGLVAVGIFLWQNALLVMATRDHYAISTERA